MNDHLHHSVRHTSYPDINVLLLPFITMLLIYLLALLVSRRRGRAWPVHRVILWTGGICCAAIAVSGPLAQRAHTDFAAHMLTHLLLGMLAPLLLVLAAPMTLLLRALPVQAARKLSRVLKSPLLQFYHHPITASVLNIGGLWLLYTSDLYAAMGGSTALHILVHIHVFFAGFLFTAAMLHIDPAPQRFSFLYRSVVLIIALAGHGILSKYIYIHPPSGVPSAQAESGAMLMYYGGDAVDVLLIWILCRQWFRAAGPRSAPTLDQ